MQKKQKKIKQLIKPKKPFIDNEEDEEEDFRAISEISLGDIRIVSKQGLPACKRTLRQLLKDKNIRSYLDIHNKKKLLNGLSYLG